MAKIILFAVACAALSLCQLGLANPVSRVVRATSSEEKEEQLKDTPRNRLYMDAKKNFTALAEYAVEQTKVMFSKMVREGAALNEAQLQPHLDELNEFVQKANELEGLQEPERSSKLVSLSIWGANTIDEYSICEADEPTNAIRKMTEVFKNNGGEELHTALINRFISLIETFATKVEAYLSTLEPEQQANNQELIHGSAKLKKEKDLDTRVDLYINMLRALKE